MRRVVVLGNTGAGKSTFAAALAAQLGVRHIELDSLFWEPGWQETGHDTFVARVREASAVDGWVACGNYLRSGAEVLWPRADTAVWLDLPLPVVLYRSVTRTARRAVTREAVCNGNTEKLRYLLPIPGGEKPLWVFAIEHHREKRPRIESMLADHSHLDVHRLRSRAEVSRFLGAVDHHIGG